MLFTAAKLFCFFTLLTDSLTSEYGYGGYMFSEGQQFMINLVFFQ